MSDIIEEIQQDIKDERFAKLWNEYGNYVIGLAIAVVLGTAGSVWWKDSVNTKNEAQGSQLFEAVVQTQQGEVDEAISSFSSLAQQGTPVASAIASLKKASLLAEEEKFEEAIAVYDQVAKSAKAPVELKELADLLYVNTVINATNLNETKEVEARLKRLTRQGAPWRYSALELSAFYSLGKGDKERAGELFQNLVTEQSTPARIRNRASEMMNAINS